MNKSDITKMQMMLLEDLKIFDQFCESHNIQYFLSSGSLLGAIRHHGFIPWDDDLDIMLTRDNYEKLLLLFDQYPSGYLLLNNTNDESIPIIYSHLVDTRAAFYKRKSGTNHDYLHIDIYACDYIKNNRFVKGRVANGLVLLINRVYSFRKGNVSIDNKSRALKKIAIMVGNFILKNKTDEEMESLIRTLVGTSKDEGLMAPIASPYGFQKEMFPSKYYKELIKVDFEDTIVPVSKYYDNILKQLYGDYMTLPPEDQRYKEIQMYHFDINESDNS